MSAPGYPEPMQPVVPMDADPGGWGPLALYTDAGERIAGSSVTSDNELYGAPGEVGGLHRRADARPTPAEPVSFAPPAPPAPILARHARATAESEPVSSAEGQWSSTSYSGPRRHRPRADVEFGTTGPGTAGPERPATIPGAGFVGDKAANLDAAGPDTADTDAAGPDAANTDPANTDAAGPDAAASGTANTDAAGADAAGSADRSLLSSSRTMAVASLASRITGFLRTQALVAALGIAASKVADAYNVANTLPNMVYTLLIGGVLSSVVIPLIVHAQEHDADRGEAYTQRLLSWGTAGLAVVTAIAVAGAPWLSGIFAAPRAERELISIFATLLLPEIFFYGLGALYTAVLNTRGVYGPPAWASVLNNVVTIVTVGVFAVLPGPKLLTESTITTGQILVLGIGTTLGIVVQALILIPYLRRSGFRWQWRFRAGAAESVPMSEVRTLAGWVLGYVAFSQLGVYVINRVAIAYKGGVSTFTYGDLLFQMPYGIIAVSLLTALMPRMSRSAARADRAGVVADLSLGSRLSAVGLVPVTGFLIVLAPTLTTVLFSYGRSDTTDSRNVGVLLALGAFGLLPFAIVMLQLRVFYAMRDTRTPTLINAFMVGTKVLLALGFAAFLPGDRVVIWLEFVTSSSYLVGAIVGHVLLTRRFGRLGFGAVARTTGRICAVTAVGSVVALGIVLGLGGLLGRGPGGSAISLVAATVVGGAVLVGLLRVVRIAEVDQMLATFRRPRS